MGEAGSGSCFLDLFLSFRWRNNKGTLEMTGQQCGKGELTAHILLLEGKTEKPKCGN